MIYAAAAFFNRRKTGKPLRRIVLEGQHSVQVMGLLLPLLYAVFILSGAAGLIYESIWTRYLGLFVGHSAYAQVIVLVMFLGGMSIGALSTGAFST